MVSPDNQQLMRRALEQALAEMPVVAILRGITPHEIDQIADALVARGIRLIEVPLNSPNAWLSIERLVHRCGDQAIVGAGTVLDVADVERLHRLGAQLLVTPNTDIEVLHAAAAKPLISIIGCMSPTEALTAARAGATALKIFPAATLGAGYLREIGAILPGHIPRLAVGGITAGNAAEFLRHGAAGLGVGTALYRSGDPVDQVQEKVDRFIDRGLK